MIWPKCFSRFTQPYIKKYQLFYFVLCDISCPRRPAIISFPMLLPAPEVNLLYCFLALSFHSKNRLLKMSFLVACPVIECLKFCVNNLRINLSSNGFFFFFNAYSCYEWEHLFCSILFCHFSNVTGGFSSVKQDRIKI